MHSGDITEHYSVGTITLNGSILLVQSFSDVVKLLLAIHAAHEPQICPCRERRSRYISKTPVLKYRREDQINPGGSKEN